jgi:integrase
MGEVHFHLKEPKSSKPTSIVLIYWLKNERIKYHTDEKVLPASWDKESQRADESKEYKGNGKVNKNLNRYVSFLDNLVELAKYNKTPLTPELIKNSLDSEFKAFKRDPGPLNMPKITLMAYVDLFIDECKTGKRLTPKGKLYKDWTIKGFKTLILHLNEHQKYYKKTIDFKDITLDFYDDFLKYFNDHKKRINTIGKHVKNLKTIMNAATEDGYNINLDYQKKKFRVVTEETDKIYLTEDELLKLYELDLSNNKRLDPVKDLFIIGAYTGLRFGDMEKLTGENFILSDKMNYLKITTQKTDINVMIPLKDIILSIYNKYEGKLPRCISNQKMNDYLKDIGEKAKIEDIINVSTTKGGMRYDESFKKWELITTHTARRSAATNMYLAGIPTISIMKITGHRTEKAFLKYIRISQEDNALKLSEHPYFKNTMLKIV